MKIWLYIINFAFLSASICTIPHTCENESCKILQETKELTEPQYFNYHPISCPEFKGQLTCCSEEMNMRLQKLFYMIDLSWGNASGGCDICAANIKRLWCWLICSPSQSEFLKPENLSAEGNSKHLMNLTASVTSTLAQSLYHSCKNCHRIFHIPDARSPENFIKFQRENSAGFILASINFTIEDESKSLDLNFASCDTNTTSLYGFNVKPCSCKK